MKKICLPCFLSRLPVQHLPIVVVVGKIAQLGNAAMQDRNLTTVIKYK